MRKKVDCLYRGCRPVFTKGADTPTIEISNKAARFCISATIRPAVAVMHPSWDMPRACELIVRLGKESVVIKDLTCSAV